MALITSKKMFAQGLDKGYAIGAFNVNNMEIIQAVAEAAREEKTGVILQVSSSALAYAKPVYLRKMVEAAIEDTGVDICLHLDHGADFDICKKCVDEGFTSVMIDGSKYAFDDNVALTRRVVEYAHSRGVVVEAELGKLAGIEDAVNVSAEDAAFTVPEEAAEFVKKTKVDSLAVAIGTSHGAYKFQGEPRLELERLEQIHAAVPGTPLVLHGASTVPQELVELCNLYGGDLPGAKGVPEKMIREAAARGICKVNMDTDIRLMMTAKIREYLAKNTGVFDPRKYLGESRKAITEMVRHKLKNVLGSSGSNS